MTNRRIIPSLFVLTGSFIFSACSPTTKTPLTNLETESPNVTLTGTIIQAGTRFSLSISGKPPVELDSRKVKLVDYVGKTVSVIGQYSGTTLFVDKIE